MAEEKMVMFDKISLAVVFAKTLSAEAECLAEGWSLGDRPVKTALIDVFPWLDNYHIRRDGNDLRWKAWDDRDDESAIVYTKLGLCTNLVRDWILQFVEEGGAHG